MSAANGAVVAAASAAKIVAGVLSLLAPARRISELAMTAAYQLSPINQQLSPFLVSWVPDLIFLESGFRDIR